MTENMSADSVQSRQVGFVRCCPKLLPTGIAILVCVLSTMTYSANAEGTSKEYTINDYSVAEKFYSDIINDPEWKSTISRVERGEKLQLPEEMLTELSTDALIEAVIDYPFFSDVYAFDNVQDGFDIMYDSFNGVRELSMRNDAATVLLDKYSNEPVLTETTPDSDVFRITDIEILISQDFITDKLSDTEKKQLINVASKKYMMEKESDVYGDYTTGILYDLVSSNCDDTEFRRQMQSYISYVYTPNNTAVQVIVNTTEPLTADQINQYNSEGDSTYPNAIRCGSSTGKYNCHSYAWYYQSTSNNCWMNDPSAYWEDYSYLSTNNPQSGNKMIYTYYGNPEHSAVIDSRLSGPSQMYFMDLVYVFSKWGPNGLYYHRGNDCPYTYCNGVGYFY